MATHRRPTHRRFTQRGIAFVCAVVVGLVPATGGVVRADDNSGGSAEDAAREIAAARARANAAAEAFFTAESKLETLADEKDRLDAQTATMEAQVKSLQKAVEAVVVSQYIGAGTTGIALLSGTVGPTEQAQTAMLVDVVNDVSNISLDDYNQLLDDLAQQHAKADKTAAAYEAAQVDFKNKEQAANDEVARLKAVEKNRLQDEAVLRALEAQRQKAAEAAQKAIADQQRIDQAAAAAAALAAEGSGSDGGDDGQGIQTGNVASGSSAGGTTGGGGSGGHPALGVGAIYGQGEAWVCPIQPVTATAFADTFGQARSGGRLHQGVDMISARGTQIVAVVDGVATAKQNTLGGNTISFAGNDGNRYYYAHLDSYATLGPVVKGTVIGYVGDTGNARFSTPHLHFEIHPAGGPAVDPTPTVAANC